MKFTLTALMVVATLSFQPVRGAELSSMEEVLKFSTEKSESYKTFSADFTQTMSLMGAAMAFGGHMQFKQPMLMRYDIGMQMMGQNQKILCVIGADKVVWQDVNTGPMKQVIKIDFQKAPTNSAAVKNPFEKMDPKQQWRTAQEKYDFKLTGSDELAGQRMYVILGSPKANAKWTPQETAVGMTTARSRIHIGQQDGFMHKMELLDKSSTNLLMSMEFTNLKFNEEIPETQFVYKPAPDAQVVDMTQMMLQQLEPPPPATVPQKQD
jgi:outer membrane lipoprotein-sorting protein